MPDLNYPTHFPEVPKNDLLFSTKERDMSTGLDYFGFRYYDAVLGKFTTRDPSGYPDGSNNQLYVNNNPINSIDPLGLQAEYTNFDFKKHKVPQKLGSKKKGDRKLTKEEQKTVEENLDKIKETKAYKKVDVIKRVVDRLEEHVEGSAAKINGKNEDNKRPTIIVREFPRKGGVKAQYGTDDNGAPVIYLSPSVIENATNGEAGAAKLAADMSHEATHSLQFKEGTGMAELIYQRGPDKVRAKRASIMIEYEAHLVESLVASDMDNNRFLPSLKSRKMRVNQQYSDNTNVYPNPRHFNPKKTYMGVNVGKGHLSWFI